VPENPTQNRRYRHIVTLELESSNAGLDDWGRALEPYTPETARRHIRRAIRDGGFPEDFTFKVLDHDVSELRTRQRSRLTIVRRETCNDCEERRVCFKVRLRGHEDRWACVEECADKAWGRGWRPVMEPARA